MGDSKKINLKWQKALKITGIVLGAIIVLAIIVNLIIAPLFSGFGGSFSSNLRESMMGGSYATGISPQASSYKSTSDISLSTRNIASEEVMDGVDYGNYEVTQYSATIETGKLKEDCNVVADLKGRDYVVFENSNIAERYCSFSFKVDKDKSEEVLEIIKKLKPRDIDQNIESIKKEIEDYTSREEILKNKQASIDETLENAIAAYDEITELATKTNNADSLAKVIDSKINILERLTAQRLQVSSELERLAKAKAEELDRLQYVNFYVYIYENKIFDGQNFKDYWVLSAKNFVSNSNQLLKDLSLGLVELLLIVVKYFIYIFSIIIAIRISWKLGKKIWKK